MMMYAYVFRVNLFGGYVGKCQEGECYEHFLIA